MNYNHILKTYHNTQVLELETLSFQDGLAHGLLGANGAGKSTLIKILMGLVFDDNNQTVDVSSVAMLPENPYLPENLTALQIVKHACRSQVSDVKPQDLLEEVGLKKDAWKKYVRTYSKGMKQRTAIAAVLASRPKWLILDEPMSGLDAMGRKHMLDIFEKRKSGGMSLLMCSHAVTDLVRLCDQVHIMAKGRMCESIMIKEHSMLEVESLERKLIDWSGSDAVS